MGNPEIQKIPGSRQECGKNLRKSRNPEIQNLRNHGLEAQFCWETIRNPEIQKIPGVIPGMGRPWFLAFWISGFRDFLRFLPHSRRPAWNLLDFWLSYGFPSNLRLQTKVPEVLDFWISDIPKVFAPFRAVGLESSGFLDFLWCPSQSAPPDHGS